jgi:hypothetical protein
MKEIEGSSIQSIHRIKEEIRSRFLENQRWRHCGLQLSICYPGEEYGLVEKIFKLKNKLLLLDLYKLIFKEGNDYRLVFFCMKELLTELELPEESKDWISDPILMTTYCIREYVKQEEQQVVLESLLLLTKKSNNGN